MADFDPVHTPRFTLEAVSLNLPDTPGHPNKMRFSGVLTRIDVPSDGAPKGSGNRRIVLGRSAAEAALPTLLGMAVDFVPNLDDHDPRTKIGIIDGAAIESDALVVSGFLYAADFPEIANLLRARSGELGFSFEADNVCVADATADPLFIIHCVFTGAAVIRKCRAAFRTTSFNAAAADKEVIMPITPNSPAGEPTISDTGQDTPSAVAVELHQLAKKLSGFGQSGTANTAYARILRAMADDLAGAGTTDHTVEDIGGSGSGDDADPSDNAQTAISVRATVAGSSAGVPLIDAGDHQRVQRNFINAVHRIDPSAGSYRGPMRKSLSSGRLSAGVGAAESPAAWDERRTLAEWDQILADLPVEQRIEFKVSLRQRNLIA